MEQKKNANRYWSPEKERKYHLAKHGITVEDWKKYLQDIDNKCSICGVQSYKLFVDHDHSTGAVRGAICTHCNRGLGAFYDSPELLSKAIEFLKSPPLESKKWVSRHSRRSSSPNKWMDGRSPRTDGL